MISGEILTPSIRAMARPLKILLPVSYGALMVVGYKTADERGYFGLPYLPVL